MDKTKSGLKRHLNLFGLCIFGIGVIIGAGIYSVVGVAYGHAGTSLWLSFILAALSAILTALSYCELATMFPSAGAEYVYLRKAFPNSLYPSFIIAIILLIAGAATAATVAMAFSGYLQYFFSFSPVLAAILLIFIVSLINYFGIQASNYFNVVLTIIELSGIVLVIWYGATTKVPLQHPTFSLSKGTFVASSLIFFVYLGFEEIANLAEETKDPGKTIPLAIILSLVITTALYIAVSFSIITLADVKSLATSKFPLAQALANRAPQMETVLSAIALFSTANTVLITLLVGARMLFSVSREGDLPRMLSKTHEDYSSPHIASLIMFVLSCVFLFVGNFEDLISLSSFAALLGFGAVNIAVIRLRYKMPSVQRPFIVPLRLFRFPVLPGLGIILIIILCMQFSLRIYLYTIFITFLCSIYYFYKKRNSSSFLKI